MIGESTTALVLIRAAIVSLRAIAPLSFVYWTLVVLSPVLSSVVSLPFPILFSWSTLNVLVWTIRLITGNEIWFYFWSQAKVRQYQIRSEQDTGFTPEERARLFRQVMGGIDDPRKFVSGWFKGADVDQVYRENIAEWLLWAFFNKHSREEYLNDAENPTTIEVHKYVDQFAQETGISARPGYNPAITCIRLNSDPVNTIHRPALVYLVSQLLFQYYTVYRN